LQSLLFIAVLLLPFLIENHTEFGGDLAIVHSHDWIWLLLLPITFQILLIFVPGMMKRRFGTGWFLATYFLSALLLVSLIYPASAFLAPYKSAYPLTQVLKTHLPANQQVYQYKIFLYGIESYTDIRTSVVDSFGEMEFGMQKLSKEKFDELNKAFPRLHVIWSNSVYYVIRLED
jgi:hypothetical protein